MRGFAEKIGAGEPEARLETLAKSLFATLTDDCPALRFNVARGPRVWDIEARAYDRQTYTEEWRPAVTRDANGTETQRTATARCLLAHLRGDHDVAIAAPSWSSLLVLDIDRPATRARSPEEPVDLEEELRADGRRDEVLSRVWRALELGPDRLPVLLSSPGHGYHLYLPLDRAWPVAWSRQHLEHHLDRHRLGLNPGVLELYPTGVPLRAPCGRGSALLVPQNPGDPDNLHLVPVHVERRLVRGRTRLVRQVQPYVADFLAKLHAARRPLEAWLSEAAEAPAWDPETWGPFGKRKISGGTEGGGVQPYQHNSRSLGLGAGAPPGSGSAAPASSMAPALPPRDSRGGEGGLAFPGAPSGDQGPFPPPVDHGSDTAPFPRPRRPAELRSTGASGKLLFGREFRERVVRLSVRGLVDTGERHDGALKWAWYWAVVEGKGREDVLAEVERWLRSLPHESDTRRRRGLERFVRDTMREVTHYLDKRILRMPPKARVVSTSNGRRMRAPELAAADRHVLAEVTVEGTRSAAEAILTYLVTFADEKGRVAGPVSLSARLLEALCGQGRLVDDDGRRRRAHVVALEELERAGLLQVHTDYSVGHHGRQYTVWYAFGSGRCPARDPEMGLVLGVRRVAEGELVAVAGEVGEPPVARLRTIDDGIALPNGWWKRMYARRAFTPAEFFDADERHVLPGPFRDRRPKATEQEEGSRTNTSSSLFQEAIVASGKASSTASSKPGETSSVELGPPESPPAMSWTERSLKGATARRASPPIDKVVEVAFVKDPDLRELLGAVWTAWKAARGTQ